MTERLVIDYAWGAPSPRAIAAAGYEGVIRYLSHTPSKNLTVRELAQLRAERLSVALVWETKNNRAADGHQAGVTDARAAEQQADSLGYPASSVIFFAVDYDAELRDVEPYFRGIATASSRPAGIYGGFKVIDPAVAPVLYRWQTAAWSAGRRSGRAHLYQRLHPSRTLRGDFDENLVLADYGQWKADAPPAPQEDDMTPEQDARLRNIERLISDQWGTTVSEDLHGAFQSILDQRIRPLEEALARIERALHTGPAGGA